MPTIRSTTLALVSLLMALAGALTVAGPASASDSPVDPATRGGVTDQGRNYWGAIALSADNYAVTIQYRPTKAKAKHVVVKECKRISHRPSTCQWVAVFANQCGSLVVTTDPQSGYVTAGKVGFGKTQRKADKQALKRLPGGHVRAGVCTPHH